LYRKSRSIRQKLFKRVPENAHKYPYSIATTWKMSFDIIKDDPESPQAIQLLTLFAFLNPDLILLEFLEAGASALDESLRNLLNDAIEMDQVITVLERFSLIKRIQGGHGIWIHRLVQEVIQHDLREDD
jgi:hypothetical protein